MMKRVAVSDSLAPVKRLLNREGYQVVNWRAMPDTEVMIISAPLMLFLDITRELILFT